MPDLTTMYVSLKLRNPLVAASAGTTERLERMKKAEDHGIGAIVMKSLFEEEVCRIAPTPRYKIIRRSLNGWSSFVFYSYEQASEWGLERYAEELRRAREALSIPVIPSINCITDEGWVHYARTLEQAGALALELNVSCPHGSIIFRGPDEAVAEMVRVTRLVREAVNIPIVVKMSPQLTSPLATAKALEEAGANGVVMFNRLVGLDIDVEEERPVLHGGYAGHGGPWGIHYPLRWITEAYPQLKIDIAGSGGVSSGQDVVKYLLAGATVVQMCTAIMLQGYQVIARVIQELENWMESKGYASISEFRGKVSGNSILSTAEVNRTHNKKAFLTQRCNNCRRCVPVCLFSAIEIIDEKVQIKEEACDGCGLCVEVCNRNGVKLIYTTEVRE